MQGLISRWHGEAVVVRYDHPTETWMFIAIHDTTLGPAMGGCRMRMYASPTDGLRDAMRLAEGMTQKWAVIGFEKGGGKSVLAVQHPLQGEEREGVFLRFARLVESLRGIYACGVDLGTTPADMAVMARETSFVHGVDRGGGKTIDPGPFTALGVFVGMRAAVRQVFGDGELAGRTVLVQGAGDVGVPLARSVADAGARVLLSDIDEQRAQRIADELGGEVVPPDRVYTTPCDIYAPCAVGATLNQETIPVLACRIVAGSANIQLAEPADADRLHERGILYAPDFVINAGGATALPLLDAGTNTAEQVRERIRGFENAMSEIFADAAERNESPLHAVANRVERVLEKRRGETARDGEKRRRSNH